MTRGTWSLMFGTGVLLIGSGLLTTATGVRAGLENFPEILIGLMMSAYYLGYGLGSMVCLKLVDRVGYIRTFSALSALFTASCVAHALVVEPIAWIIFRFFTGLSMVGLYLVVESWLNLEATNENRGRVFSTYTAVTLLSLAMGQYLLLLDGSAGAYLFLIAVFFTALASIPVALVKSAEPVTSKTAAFGLKQLWAASPLGVMGALMAGLANSPFWSIGPVFAQKMGFSEAGIAGYMAATIVGGAVLQKPIGYLSDRFDRRRVLLWACIAGFFVALGAAFLPASIAWAFYVMTFLYGGIAFSVYSLCVSHTNDHLDAPRIPPAIRGLNLTFGVGAVIGPIIVGVLMQSMGAKVLMPHFAACWGILAIFTLYRMTQSAPVPMEKQGKFVHVVRTSPVAGEIDPRGPKHDH